MTSQHSEATPLSHPVTESFAGSALFDRTFDEGMSLVQETATYLEGRGRIESRDLPRKAATLYAGESLRLTTRLMQAASWLLVQRAVHDGEMDAEDATSERYRLGSKEICFGGQKEGLENLPAKFLDLLARSETLYCRIARLEDGLLKAAANAGARGHIDRLEQAFESETQSQA
jgi:regulator of CtrA degradation